MPTVATVNRTGTRGAQPTLNTKQTGTLYYVTDEGVLERWSGTAWVEVAIDSSAVPTAPASQSRLYLDEGSEDAISDEFDDASLAGAWTRVDKSGHSGHLTWTEAAGVISAAHDASADTGTSFRALLKSLGALTYPITIQAAIRHFASHSANYQMLGLVFADGTTHGAGNQCIQMPFHYSTSARLRHSIRDFNNWETQASSNDGMDVADGNTYHWRLKYTAANSFTSEVSPNGIDWMDAQTITSTQTPTHAGLLYSTWGTVRPGIGTFEYFRVY